MCVKTLYVTATSYLKKFKLPFLKNEASPSFNSKSHFRANSLKNTCSYFFFFFVIFACRSEKNFRTKNGTS